MAYLTLNYNGQEFYVPEQVSKLIKDQITSGVDATTATTNVINDINKQVQDAGGFGTVSGDELLRRTFGFDPTPHSINDFSTLQNALANGGASLIGSTVQSASLPTAPVVSGQQSSNTSYGGGAGGTTGAISSPDASGIPSYSNGQIVNNQPATTPGIYPSGTILYHQDGTVSVSDGNTQYGSQWGTTPTMPTGTQNQSINPINVNDPNDPGQLAYNARLAAMQQATNNFTPVPALGSPEFTNYLISKGNTLGMNLSKYTVPTTPISSKSLGGSTPLDVKSTFSGSTSGTSSASAITAGAEASLKSIDEYMRLLTPPDTNLSKEATSLRSQISSLLGGLGGRGQAQLQAEQQFGVQAKKEALMAVQSQITQKLAEYKARQAEYDKLQVQNENRPVTMNSIIGTGAAINRMALAEKNSAAADIGLLQAQALGLQGQYDVAVEAANRSVDLRYQDQKDLIDIKLQQLDLITDQLTKQEKTRADAISLWLNDQKTRIATAVANEKDKNATLLNLMQKYVDAGITLNDTLVSANQKIVQSSKIYQQETRLAGGTSGGSGGGTTGKKLTSGSLVYTSSDIGEGQQKLEASRGTDGYVDPSIYLAMYETWTKAGGLLQDFLSKYPPKNYVNPANTWLPVYLMPAGSRKDEETIF